MQRASLSGTTAAIVALVVCTAPASARSDPDLRPGNYVDVAAYLQTDEAFEAWFTLRHQLYRNFDAICGDTFCEGDYSNIQSLRFVCSVHRVSGLVGSCAWSFAASEESVARRSGRISAETPAWLCVSPLVAGTTIEALLHALQGEEPLYAALPGTSLTLYDGLVDCL
ncbi:hypothetical protein [Luteimonas sp. MC1825]|uniref:hypothetical protein n=1 Tax=Luteimonas sp. MC1825 TaxID=2761107 RepID=UPI001609B9C6|nr:hypothetical protein [Luteimonas sp. MC1825]MBB6598653.1 hypothetical protein [Luteimonas sp. MC1825]QOC88828.1 hypothetical protein IDM46_03495 [Luteimonas sp. MC1825]